MRGPDKDFQRPSLQVTKSGTRKTPQNLVQLRATPLGILTLIVARKSGAWRLSVRTPQAPQHDHENHEREQCWPPRFDDLPCPLKSVAKAMPLLINSTPR